MSHGHVLLAEAHVACSTVGAHKHESEGGFVEIEPVMQAVHVFVVPGCVPPLVEYELAGQVEHVAAEPTVSAWLPDAFGS